MRKRVLVVDDEENIRQMTRLTLEAAGYEVGEAGTGMEVFAILGGDALWDVVLLDQKMPGITMNGFTILESENAWQAPDERRFTVESPSGEEHDVLVQIDAEAVGYVERMTRRKLPPENSFWTAQAERLLSNYLWNEGKVPPTRKLTLKDVDRDELPVAARW